MELNIPPLRPQEIVDFVSQGGLYATDWMCTDVILHRDASN